MQDLRPVGFVVGLIVAVLGLTMLAPLLLDLVAGNGNADAFAKSAFICLLVGGLVAIASQNGTGRAISVRAAFLLTLGIWVFVPLFGSLPFQIGAPGLSLTDAYFEAVSGITTTGSRVILGLDTMPAGMNLWRGMLNWLGGLGIAFIAMIFLPVMRVGGMQFFRTEGFDTLGKVLPRATDIARNLMLVYVLLTVACMTTYAALGMSPLDAVVNAMATIATGGFSPSDASFNKYRGAAEYAGALFMILGSLPYIRYAQILSGSARPLLLDPQVRAYLRWIAIAVGAVTLWHVVLNDAEFEPTLREALFNLASIFSGTGFFSGTFAAWGGFALIVALIVGFIGGCSASSSGALTVFRVQIALRAIAAQIRLIHSPHRISDIRYDGRRVDDEVMNQVVMYVYSYIFTVGVMCVLVTLTGVDLVSALFAVWTSIGNIGYGIGPMVAPTGTFIEFPTAAKWLLIITMLMGRIALLAFLVIVLPRFWRA